MSKVDKKRHVPMRARKHALSLVPKACPSHKRCFLSRHQALMASRHAQGKYGSAALTVYRCTNLPRGVSGEPCGQYHITSNRNRY
jgi:hypothetical protein